VNPRRTRVGPFAAILAAAAGVGACNLAIDGDVDSTDALLLGTLGLQVLMALMAVAGASLSPAPLRIRLGLEPGRLSAPLLGLLVIGTLGLSLALDGLLTLSELRDRSVLAALDEELQGIRGGTLALALLGLGIAPGIAEELLCRGLLQRGLQPRLGARKAIALAAIAFGALHLEAIHGVLAAILGLYFGIATYLAGSVRAAILCHTVNNLVSVAVTAWGAIGAPPAPVAIAGGLPVACGCLWAVWRRAGSPPASGRPSPAADGPRPPGDGLQLPAGSDDA
jgi:membrane protease YdiL (CAAX protease family)